MRIASILEILVVALLGPLGPKCAERGEQGVALIIGAGSRVTRGFIQGVSG